MMVRKTLNKVLFPGGGSKNHHHDAEKVVRFFFTGFSSLLVHW